MITTLYGLDKKAGFKVWTIETDDQGLLTIRHGKEGGKLQVKSEQVKVKNKGRANETSLGQQAENEALGRIKKQKDKGYRENKADLEALPVLAMLAGDYNKIGHRIDFTKTVYGSDKFDGVRCMAKKQNGVVTLESRTGQPWTLPHVVEQLERVMREGEILDGELYKHGYALQDITSAVKRTDTQGEIDRTLAKMSKDNSVANADAYDEAVMIHYLRLELEFHVFDVVTDEPFYERRARLFDVFDRVWAADAKHLHTVDYYIVESDEQLRLVWHPDAVRRGFEGVMLRNADGLYESGKRSADLQKYKTFLDSEFIILDIIPDKGEGSRYVLQNDINQLTFTCTLGSMVQRAEALANKHLYIALPFTARYQTRYKKTLLPQFPTGVAIRDYE